MSTIGGKHKVKVPNKPQVVIQIGFGVNEYALLGVDEKTRQTTIDWVGDPNAATKFNSKFEAKSRTREIENIPSSRVFKMLEARA